MTSACPISQRPRNSYRRLGEKCPRGGRERVEVVDGETDRIGFGGGAAEPFQISVGRLVADTTDDVYRGVGIVDVVAQPFDIFAAVDVRVAILGVVVAERPVRHGEPHVDVRREFGPREVGPQGRVQHVERDRRVHDRADRHCARRGVDARDEVEEQTIALVDVGDGVGSLNVERDSVEPLPLALELHQCKGARNVEFVVAMRREVPRDHRNAGRVGAAQELARLGFVGDDPGRTRIVLRHLEIERMHAVGSHGIDIVGAHG